MKVRTGILITASLLVSVAASQGQDLEASLKARFKDQVLALKTPMKDKKISVNADGTLSGEPGLFSTDGLLQVKKVRVTSSEVDIEGTRGRYLGPSFPFCDMHEKIEISVRRTTDEEVSKILSSAFLSASELHHKFDGYCPAPIDLTASKPSGSPTGKLGSAPVFTLGGKVQPPKPIRTPDPDMNIFDLAGSLKLSVVVDSDGIPECIAVVNSGGSLDKKAIDALAHWTLHPATVDGRPVSVQMNVDFGFHKY